MQIGMVGLGRMGANMSQRLIREGHEVVVFDLNSDAVEAAKRFGGKPSASLATLVENLTAPRYIWMMVPAGDPTEQTIRSLVPLLERGDTVIDGGNSYYKDSAGRYAELREKAINFVDVGTSGGIWGLERGYCLMIGGDKDVVGKLSPIFESLAPGRGNIEPTDTLKPGGTAEQGYLYCGGGGAGHFVKMIHNGIEYGLMQAYAEGFNILVNANSAALPEEHRYTLPVADIAELWRRGSVVSSWLLGLCSRALNQDPQLSQFSGFVHDSGEGRWTITAALEEAVPADVLSASVYARFRSRLDHTFSDKLLSAMRSQFGGHKE